MNHIPYGGTTWGVEAAAQVFFDKPAKDITIAQAAYLAGLPQAPSAYSPFGSQPERGKNRQKEVLRRMLEEKFIKTQQGILIKEGERLESEIQKRKKYPG